MIINHEGSTTPIWLTLWTRIARRRAIGVLTALYRANARLSNSALAVAMQAPALETALRRHLACGLSGLLYGAPRWPASSDIATSGPLSRNARRQLFSPTRSLRDAHSARNKKAAAARPPRCCGPLGAPLSARGSKSPSGREWRGFLRRSRYASRGFRRH
jgi:hypothetical protein